MLDQFLNYQAIQALEKKGIKAPTQRQIDSAEECIAEWVQLIGSSVFLLEELNNKNPSLEEVQKVVNIFSRLVSGHKKSCAPLVK